MSNFYGNVAQFSVRTGGTLVSKSPATVPTGSQAEELAISPNGKGVYVANGYDYDIYQFTVGPGGNLIADTPAAVSTSPELPGAIAVSPDSASVYVLENFSVSYVTQYDAGATGALTPKSPAQVAVPGGNGEELAITPDGLNMYVTGGPDDDVAQLTIGPGGVVSAKTPSTVPAGPYPIGIAVTSGTATLSVSITGVGRVIGSAGFSCSNACSQNYSAGTVVQLTARGTPFLGWGGACSGDAVTCTVTMNANETVTAKFGSGVELRAQGILVTQGIQTLAKCAPGRACGGVPAGTQYLAPSGDTFLSVKGKHVLGGLYQGVPLVAGKTTVVKLYADVHPLAGGQAAMGVTANLYGYGPDGQPLPGSPLSPDYGPG